MEGGDFTGFAAFREALNAPDQVQMGGEPPSTTRDPLVVLLYLLMRDHLAAGVFEELVLEMESFEGKGEVSLTNRFLAGYATNIAYRLRCQDGRSHGSVNNRSKDDDCYSCGNQNADEKCPKSKRECGHHCNCCWVHDHCHWCGKNWGAS